MLLLMKSGKRMSNELSCYVSMCVCVNMCLESQKQNICMVFSSSSSWMGISIWYTTHNRRGDPEKNLINFDLFETISERSWLDDFVLFFSVFCHSLHSTVPFTIYFCMLQFICICITLKRFCNGHKNKNFSNKVHSKFMKKKKQNLNELGKNHYFEEERKNCRSTKMWNMNWVYSDRFSNWRFVAFNLWNKH